MSVTETKQLKDLAASQENLNQDLRAVEERVYELETEYIEDTVFGNFVRGLDTFLDVKARASSIKRSRIAGRERVFSLSSLTSPVGALAEQIEAEANTSQVEEPVGAAGGLRCSSRPRKRARHRNALNEDDGDEEYSDGYDLYGNSRY